MNIWEMNKVILFLALFIPGFIIIKIYDLVFPNSTRDFSKYWFDAVAFGALHYGICYIFMTVTYSQIILTNSIIFIWLILIPTCYPILLYGIVKIGLFQKFFIHPIQRPWDYFFSRNKCYWMLIHLKDGSKIAGKYDKNSFASSYPDAPEILLEEIWVINELDEIIEPIQPRRGAIILGSEIKRVEFYIWDETAKETKEDAEV